MKKALTGTSPPLNLFQVAQVELVYRSRPDRHLMPKVTDSVSAYNVLMSIWDQNKIELVEQFVILMLDRKGRCLGASTVTTGGVSSCPVDPKIIFATALAARASSIIAAHNHPSGSTEPSRADIDITKKLYAGGQLLDMPLHDHLIITPRGYHSFADYGLD